MVACRRPVEPPGDFNSALGIAQRSIFTSTGCEFVKRHPDRLRPGRVRGPVRPGRQNENVFSDDIASRVPKLLFGRLVDRYDQAPLLDNDNGVAGGIPDGTQPLFALTERFLSVLHIGDVLHGAKAAENITAKIKFELRARMNPLRDPISSDPKFDIVGGSFEGGLPALVDALAVDALDNIEEALIGQVLCRRDTETCGMFCPTSSLSDMRKSSNYLTMRVAF